MLFTDIVGDFPFGFPCHVLIMAGQVKAEVSLKQFSI